MIDDEGTQVIAHLSPLENKAVDFSVFINKKLRLLSLAGTTMFSGEAEKMLVDVFSYQLCLKQQNI